jgi:DNA-binding CsgD family transcriptional regulator
MVDKEEFKSRLLINGQWVNLSNREMECVGQLCKGKTMKGIASYLSISPRTVETHLRNIKYKLKCNYKSEIIEAYLQNNNV